MKRQMRTWRFRLMGQGGMGLLGLGLLSGSLALALAVLLPGVRHLEQLRQDVAQLRADMGRHRGQWIDRSPRASLNAFYRFLPKEGDALQQVAAVFSAADAAGVALDQGEYALSHDPAGFSRYQVILPLYGTYTDIRAFVIQLLNTMPALAVNELSFRRDDTHSPEVEARLRLTVYLERRR